MQPINSYVVKVSSRCNLACSYCYEYFAHDQSWRQRSKVMSTAVAFNLGRRISEHATSNELHAASVLLHGGEPLLLGKKGLEELIISIERGASGRIDINYGIQTNATLLNNELLDWADSNSIAIGVSCDGPPEIANQKRIDHFGIGSGEQLEKSLELLKGRSCFSGLLCVIDPTTNPLSVWKYLTSWRPPLIDFLLPHHTWQSPPYEISQQDAPYGRWLSALYDEWVTSGPHDMRVRYFEEIISRSMGSTGSLESLGEEPVTLLVT